MHHKAEGIVLHHIRHTDSHHIVHVYTRELGRTGFLVSGIHSRKTTRKPVYLQPLFLLNIEYTLNNKQGLHRIREYQPVEIWKSIPFDITKSTIALFLGEVLSAALKTEEKDAALYTFLKNSLLFMDEVRDVSNFHLWFLVHLTKYLGFFPRMNYTDLFPQLDIRNGEYVGLYAPHTDVFPKEISRYIHQFQSKTLPEAGFISLSGQTRNHILDALIRYYRLQLPGIPEMKSLPVLKALFRDAPQ